MTDTSSPSPVVAVVGGGIAGLAAAWEASRHQGTRVEVFEASARLGGKISTGELGGRPVDIGPDAFVARRPEARDLCAELGLDGDLVAPGRRGASVWARGRLRPLPAGLALGVPTRIWPLARSGICSPGGVVRAASDLLRPPSRRPTPSGGDRSVGDIVGALGPEVIERLADPLIGGIHAGSVHTMSAAAVFPALLRADTEGGSLMRALRRGNEAAANPNEPVFLGVTGGMERLVTTLAAELARRGVTIRTETTVQSIERSGPRRWRLSGADGSSLEADAVIMTAPAFVASQLLAPLDGALAQSVGAIDYASVALITVRMADGDASIPADGTGFLVPRTEGRFITACTWMSSKWPQLRVPGEALLRASAGRFGDATTDRSVDDDTSDDDIARRVVDDLTHMGVVRGAPLEMVVTRWPRSFPQYDVGHLERVAAIDDAARAYPGLALAGAALRGVGIPACIGSGRRAAVSVLEQIDSAR